jgi:hypothetical protein
VAKDQGSVSCGVSLGMNFCNWVLNFVTGY